MDSLRSSGDSVAASRYWCLPVFLPHQTGSPMKATTLSLLVVFIAVSPAHDRGSGFLSEGVNE